MRSLAFSLALGLALGLATGAANAQPYLSEGADEDVIAIVLGTKITAKDKDRLNGMIFGALLEQFASDNAIEPTEDELDAFTLRAEQEARLQPIQFEADRKRLEAELKSAMLSERERKDKQSHLQSLESLLETTPCTTSIPTMKV